MDTPTTTPPNNTRNNLALPIAILLGFGMIAAALYFNTGQNNNTSQDSSIPEVEEPNADMRPVDSTDHIRGNPNAPIMLVEYSDYECPFCKTFHESMQNIMTDYAPSGQVAWVYRHFPIDSLHPNASRIAVAAECVGELGGSTAFWQFSDLVFEERPLDALTDMSKLPEYAVSIGIDRQDFTDCQASGRHTDSVQADFENAVAIGAEGTPYTVIMVGDQEAVINGAQSYETIKQIIETLLAQTRTGNDSSVTE